MSILGKIRRIVERIFGLTIINGRLRSKISSYTGPPLDPSTIEGCKVISSRYEVLELLPKGGIIAEVGVAYGDFSEQLIEKLKPSKFYGIDLFTIKATNEPWGQNRLKTSGLSHYEYYARKMSKYSTTKVEIKSGYSWEVLSHLPNSYFDYIYLDADHSYESVTKDLEQVHPKLKTNGLVQINDYTFFNIPGFTPYGVRKATNELMTNHSYRLKYFCLHQNDLFDVVIQKLPNSRE